MKTKVKNNDQIFIIKNQNIFQSIKDRIDSGNLGSTVIVPHVCNNVNGFGAGFAGDIANYYPIVKDNFHLLGTKAKLGHTQFVIADSNITHKHNIIFANMIAQNGIISHNNRRPLNYAALTYCMAAVKAYIADLLKNNDSKIEIHAPKFGSGLAGGDWNFIKELVCDIWSNCPIFIYNK
jgi:hypothetical protein